MAAKLGQTRIQKVAEGMRRNDLVVKYSVRFSWLAPMLAVTLSILQGGSVQAAFLGYSIGHLVLFSTALFGVGREVVAGSLTRDFFQGPFSARQRAVARRLIRYSGPQAGIGMSLVIYNNSGVLLIQRFLGSTDAGQYALAMRLIEMLALPGMAAGSATGPLFATGGDDVWRRALNLSSRLAVLYIPVGVAAYLFLPTVLTRFVGPQYAQASAVVIWLQPFLVLRVLASFYGAILDYLGAGYRRVAVVMTTTALFIASGVAVLPHVGLGGAVVVTTLTYLPLVAAYAFMIVGHANRGKNRFVRPEAEVLGPSATVITDRMPVDMSGSVSVS